jgi:hypothetical protein
MTITLFVLVRGATPKEGWRGSSPLAWGAFPWLPVGALIIGVASVPIGQAGFFFPASFGYLLLRTSISKSFG